MLLSAFNRACSVPTTLWRSCRCLPHRRRRHTRCLSTIGGAGCRLSDGKISYCLGRPEKVLPNSQYHPISANIAQYPIPDTGIVRTLLTVLSSIMVYTVQFQEKGFHLTHLTTLSPTLSAVFGMYICP